MWSIDTDGVAWSVCPTVGWTDRNAVFWGGLTRVSPGNHVLDGCPDTFTGKDNFWGLSGPLKSIESPWWGVRNKRDHSIVNNGM